LLDLIGLLIVNNGFLDALTAVVVEGRDFGGLCGTWWTNNRRFLYGRGWISASEFDNVKSALVGFLTVIRSGDLKGFNIFLGFAIQCGGSWRVWKVKKRDDVALGTRVT
jgi:hypothetical protein